MLGSGQNRDVPVTQFNQMVGEIVSATERIAEQRPTVEERVKSHTKLWREVEALRRLRERHGTAGARGVIALAQEGFRPLVDPPRAAEAGASKVVHFVGQFHCDFDGGTVQQVQVPRQQAAAAERHQALGVSFRIVLGQPAPAAGGQDDRMHLIQTLADQAIVSDSGPAAGSDFSRFTASGTPVTLEDSPLSGCGS